MKATVKKQNTTLEYYHQEGCYITEISNSADDPELSIARARVKPGVATRHHKLNGIAERYVILKGTGVVEIGSNSSATVAAGDVVVIPPGHVQRIKNTSADDLIFLAICTPRFRPICYEDVEKP